MPLIKSGSRAAIGTNIREMVAAGHPQRVAVAAALHTADKYASGGGVKPHAGFLASTVPGRTDKLPITVGGGAYVLPADHVAALGQGNSLSGADIVNKMFKSGPYGSTQMKMSGTRAPKQKRFADGGSIGAPTDIIAAGGEIVIPPEKIIERFGSLDHGHKALDKWVVDTRKKHIETLKGLKPPKVD